jgi:hypothetical protein
MEHKSFTAQPSPETKSYLAVDAELAALEAQLSRAVSEVKRLSRLVAVKRASVGALFNAARELNG